MSFLKRLLSKTVKRKVIHEFLLDDIPHRIVEHTSWVPGYKSKREIIFKAKDDNRVFIHSSIFLSPKQHFQPIFTMPQKIAYIWNKSFVANNVLVLGCAGCTFPRFYALEYPESKITGVELSEKLVEIANKYFLLDQIKQQFNLYCDDAFKFVKDFDFKAKQDIIFVDIFAYNQLPSDVFSKDFLKSLFDCTSNDSMVIFNFLQEDYNKILDFAKSIEQPFNEKYVVSANERCYMLLLKTENENKKEAFKNSINEIAKVFE